LVVAQRKYATAQQSLDHAKRFLTLSQDLERGGEAAHSDVIKAQLQVNAAEHDFKEAQLAMSNARDDLAVLVFPNFNADFTVVDDLSLTPSLPSFSEAQTRAKRESPDLEAAMQALRQASLDVSGAKKAFLPTFSVDTDYGIEANAFALRSRVSADPRVGRLPNLGYFVTGVITLPVWDWGAMRCKLDQAEYHRQQARAELTLAQRELLSNLYMFYHEAETSRSEVETLRQSAELAEESVRLTTLRYQAGEATVLEVVDAQNTLGQARNAYDDGQARYRVALANLQTLTGTF
jgi:outer membrane protein TolC